MPKVERKLTTILAADVVGYSKLMGKDEAGTLETLKVCRSIIDSVISEHHGRVFASAGDSVLAEFASPVEAVWCASKFQKLLAERGAHPATKLPMQFRVGVNIGDIMIEGENLYGDGVNVAARLEAIAEPGGICVSSKVYEEVKRKLDVIFASGGVQSLKNIEDPIAVYHLLTAAEGGTGPEASAQARSASTSKTAAANVSEIPTVIIRPLKVIGGDTNVSDLAIGLAEDILGSLTKQTTIKVLAPQPHDALLNQDAPQGSATADFALEGSIRASGQRLRLAFSLVDVEERSQIWSERYDRTFDDVFKLQDEISRNVTSTVRVRIKARIFERLRSADNGALSIRELLDKAAGYFVRPCGGNREAEAALRVAAEKAPNNSMAMAMLAWCLYREGEFSPRKLPAQVSAEIISLVDKAISLDQSSYFARFIQALVRQDMLGDFGGALTQAEAALELNSGFTPAQAMMGIAKIHLGDLEDGKSLLEDAIGANKDNPHRYRYERELAIAHFYAGDYAEAVRVARRLFEQAPDLKRNTLLLAGFLAAAGEIDASRQHMKALLDEDTELNMGNARLPKLGNIEASKRLSESLETAGLPS